MSQSSGRTGDPGPSTVSAAKILVAYDASENGARALDLAVRLSRAAGASLAVLSVVPSETSRGAVWRDEERGRRDLRAAREMLRQRGYVARFLLRAGALGPAIERAVLEGGYDTVVLGSGDPARPSETPPCTISDHVAAHTRATVIMAA